MAFVKAEALLIISSDYKFNKYNHNKGFTVGVFIDFESAFPMVWRNGLLIKLKKYGITGNIMKGYTVNSFSYINFAQ